MSKKNGVGRLSMAASTRPRSETSSSVFHDTTATQSKKAHHITTMPLRISRRACRIPIGGDARSPLPPFVALSVSWLRWSVFIVLLYGRAFVRRQDYGRGPPASSAAGHNARQKG
jgi:hypothetical protein